MGNNLKIFEELNEKKIKYCIFKSTRTLESGLLGLQDLDILVCRAHYGEFTKVLMQNNAKRASINRYLQGTCREDWFIPLEGKATYIHFDVHTSVMVGSKFSKDYFSYDFSSLEINKNDNRRPALIDERGELLVTLTRISFRSMLIPFDYYIKIRGDWTREVIELCSDIQKGKDGGIALNLKISEKNVNVKMKIDGDLLFINAKSLWFLRSIVLKKNDRNLISLGLNRISSHLNRIRYLSGRLMEYLNIDFSISRRSPITGGLLVAIVAPDGVGKTSMVQYLKNVFSWKFDAIQIYMGTGDGSGWILRRFIRNKYIKNKKNINAEIYAPNKEGKENIAADIKRFLKLMWGILVALERLSKAKKALRARNRGKLVFADRWPQSIQCGKLDGPIEIKINSTDKILKILRIFELKIYNKIQMITPDLIFHLVADYKISENRKPGEITEKSYNERVNLMRNLRKTNPNIIIIDASQSFQVVAENIFTCIWKRL